MRVYFTLLAVLLQPALAQPRHEFVDPAVVERFARATPSGIAGPAGQPTAIERDGETLPVPEPGREDAPGLGEGPQRMARPTETRPDRRTEQDQPLTYKAVFNPTVAPLRRNVTFDVVNPDYRLTTGKGPRRAVPIQPGKVRPGRELFWGDLSVDAEPGVAAPIPSVAPDMGVLSVRAEAPGGGPVTVSFEKDQADNFYARVDRKGPVRLVVLVDADAAYFSAPLPGNVPLRVQSGADFTAVPPRARRHAADILMQLRVHPTGPFDYELDKLVTWFRGFTAGPTADTGRDILVDLSLGQVGVCRHRAFAFTVLARAAGVPTRYVQNEAHAFVEVRAPDGRWRRVDLGGEAPQLDIDGAQNSRLHTPPPDPFSKPENYLSQYSTFPQAGTDPEGATAVVRGAPPGMNEGGGSGSGSGGGVGEGPGSIPVEVPLPRWPEQAEAEPGDSTGPVVVSLGLSGRFDAFRGERLPTEVKGAVADETGDRIADLRVQLYLVGPDGEAFPVGPAVRTDSQGRFAITPQLPATMPLGAYRLVAASEGTDVYAPGRSDPE